jgi:hypothetical protein
LAVAASAYSSLMCLINHRGDRCIKSTSDFGEIFKDCPKFSVSTNIFKFIAAPFCSTGNDVACPGFCRQALDRYLFFLPCRACTLHSRKRFWIYENVLFQNSRVGDFWQVWTRIWLLRS